MPSGVDDYDDNDGDTFRRIKITNIVEILIELIINLL